MPSTKYVLITAARDEAAFIEHTLQSIVRQTVRPERWVIVSDGSSDATSEIVSRYTAQHDFILLQALNDRRERDFRSKALAIQYGHKSIQYLDFDYIGNLDADICVDPTYYEKLIRRFEADPRLGISGGKTYDLCNGALTPCMSNDHSVGGGAQFFRRSCWEAVGGYLPIRQGGEDTAAEVAARMKGWQVQPFADLPVVHRRESGTAIRGRYGARLHDGLQLHALGYHPVFFIARTIYRIRQPPVLLGALLTLLGYLCAAVSGQERVVSSELVAYLRNEQLQRLRLRRPRGEA